MPEFIGGYVCWRSIIDRIIDRRDNRTKCKEGEEMCDVCKEDRRFRQELETNRWARYNNRFDDSRVRINDS
jgi:hypothetical protein